MPDLFDTVRKMARPQNPETSFKAAASILPKRYTIREQVEGFAKRQGERGFIDEQLEEAFPNWAPSSWRTRRSELAQDNVILNTGRTRFNSVNREMTVWVHRSFHQNPPPLVEAQPKISKTEQIIRLEAEVSRLKALLDYHCISH